MFRKKPFLGSLLAGLLCAFGLGSPVQAQDKDSTVVSARAPVWTPELGEVPLDKYTREELSEMVRNYWTPERMRSAIPREVKVSKEFTKNTRKDFGDVYQETSEIVLSEPALPKKLIDESNFNSITNYGTANGKVFFYDPVKDKHYSCSGAAINSSSKRIVATAAHCVHDGPDGSWYQNWIFIPNYLNGLAPNGAFSAVVYWSLPGWIEYGETIPGFNSDVAFVTTDTNFSGLRVVDAVGGHGITYGGGYELDMVLFGYPKNFFGGHIMRFCSGTTEHLLYQGYDFVLIEGCNFVKGASGGPWLKSYNNDTGVGVLRGITSWGWNFGTELNPYFPYNNSPYFTSHVMALFINANSANW